MENYASRFITEINCEVTCSHKCSILRKGNENKRKKKMPRIKQRFKRPCNECGKSFRPTGKFGKFCDECLRKPEHTNGRKLWEKANAKSK